MEIYAINKNVSVTKNIVFSGLSDKNGKPVFESIFESETFEDIVNNKDLNMFLELVFRLTKKEYSSTTNKLKNFTFFFWREDEDSPICIIDMTDIGDQFSIQVFNPDDFGGFLNLVNGLMK